MPPNQPWDTLKKASTMRMVLPDHDRSGKTKSWGPWENATLMDQDSCFEASIRGKNRRLVASQDQRGAHTSLTEPSVRPYKVGEQKQSYGGVRPGIALRGKTYKDVFSTGEEMEVRVQELNNLKDKAPRLAQNLSIQMNILTDDQKTMNWAQTFACAPPKRPLARPIHLRSTTLNYARLRSIALRLLSTWQVP